MASKTEQYGTVCAVNHIDEEIKMKKTAVIIVVLLLLAAQTCLAVDLEAGWYVKLGGFATYGWEGNQWRAVDWSFTGALGPQGPFEVTNPDVWWPERQAAVPDTAVGIPAGTSVYLWMTPEVPINYTIYEAGPRWETDYDATRMRLELLMYKEDVGFALLWVQSESGLNTGFRNVLLESQCIPAGYEPVFRVTVVPEPSLPVMFGFALLGCHSVVRRKTR